MFGETVQRADLMRKYILLITGCTGLGVLFFMFMHYSQTGLIPTFKEQGNKYFLAIVVTNFLGFFIYQVDRLLDKAIHWKANFLLRFISGLGAHITLVILFFTLAANKLWRISNEEALKLSILFIIAIFIYEIFYGLFFSYRYYAVTQAEQLRSDRWQLELQFESLKSQISPHYLFNCLNTVSSLLYKDTQVAEEFIRRMADTFRYVLAHQTQRLVTLRDELEFVKSYYFLLQVRYEYHLQMEINVPQNILDSMIPPMTLQLLVENAVKHNAISKDQPLLVYISAKDNTSLIVQNTKTSAVKPRTSFRVGLENIHKRYSFFTRQKVIVLDAEKFVVELPVLKKNATVLTEA
jgi:two-component system LytT family sensor kinase